MEFVTDERIRMGVASAFSSLIHGTMSALHQGNLSLGAGFLMLIVGLLGVVISRLLMEFGVVVVGDRVARRLCVHVGRVSGAAVIGLVAFQWIVHGFGH